MDDALRDRLQADGFELIETHISRVFLRSDSVYKTKRAVDLGFLDFRELAARARACEAEVRLNRRLAPDVYLGVVALVRDPRGQLTFRPRDQLHGEPVLEWAVHMRRLPDQARADVRLSRGLLARDEVEQIAALLVRFHARCARAPAEFGTPRQVAANVEENFAQVARLAPDHVAASELRTAQDYQRAFLRAHAALLVERARAGYVRDGHGDLRLEHVYREASGEHVIIDCIEFNERFRFADVCADLGFLSMDLRDHGRVDLAELLIAAYARGSGDYGLYALIDFYESYRAFVRAKVAAILAHDAHVGTAVRERAAADARRHFLLALAASRPPLAKPRLIVTMGLIASGKSTLAQALATHLGAAVLSADHVRKELLGVAPHTPLHDAAFAGAYAPEVSARVYDVLRARATPILGSGRSAILDATFRERAQRERTRGLAAQLGAEALFLECRCAREALLSRLQSRAQAGSVSDGRTEILDDFAARFEPVLELPASEHIALDTGAPLEHTLTKALAALA